MKYKGQIVFVSNIWKRQLRTNKVNMLVQGPRDNGKLGLKPKIFDF
jgi:hypothetical protein